MTSIAITITLPDDLAQEALDHGLLTSVQITQLVRAELTRRRTEYLFTLMDRIAAAPKDDLTEADIQTEIAAYRREQRADHADRH
jgi:hypothetical protein